MDAKAAISEIESSDLERTLKWQLRRFLANNTHLLVACVPGDVVSTLQEELQQGMLSSFLDAYAATCFLLVRLPAAGTQSKPRA